MIPREASVRGAERGGAGPEGGKGKEKESSRWVKPPPRAAANPWRRGTEAGARGSSTPSLCQGGRRRRVPSPPPLPWLRRASLSPARLSADSGRRQRGERRRQRSGALQLGGAFPSSLAPRLHHALGAASADRPQQQQHHHHPGTGSPDARSRAQRAPGLFLRAPLKRQLPAPRLAWVSRRPGARAAAGSEGAHAPLAAPSPGEPNRRRGAGTLLSPPAGGISRGPRAEASSRLLLSQPPAPCKP